MSNNNLPDWERDLPLKNSILDAVHETALGLHRAGVIPDVTLREFDKLCLQPVHPLQPAQIKALREKAKNQTSGFRRLSEYQRFHRAKMGNWREKS